MSVNCILIEQEKNSGGNGAAYISLQSIAITTPPNSTTQLVGQPFDSTGMVVKGYYGTASTAIFKTINLTGYSVSPSTLTSSTTQITITYTEAGKTFTAYQPITVISWSWGSETGTANATWWNGLQAVVRAGGADSSWVGKTKSVTLTSAVLGTTTHLVQCIGVNQDGNKTVTFQTKNCLATTSALGDSNAAAVWNYPSTAKTQCQNYYNAFPGKAYIKTVSKGTNTSYSSSSVAYSDETVWLPSIYEMGLTGYTYRPPGAEYTNGCSASYSYYSSSSIRIKYANDSSSTAQAYWTRSRNNMGASYACYITAAGAGGRGTRSVAYGIAPAFVIG